MPSSDVTEIRDLSAVPCVVMRAPLSYNLNMIQTFKFAYVIPYVKKILLSSSTYDGSSIILSESYNIWLSSFLFYQKFDIFDIAFVKVGIGIHLDGGGGIWDPVHECG